MPITMFVKSSGGLPNRIGEVVAQAATGEFRAAVKTTYRPNDTIPSIWIVVTSDYLVLCNTHRTRGLWRKFAAADTQRLKLGITSTGQRYFELEDIDGGRLFLPLSQAVSPAEIDEFMAEYQRKKRT